MQAAERVTQPPDEPSPERLIAEHRELIGRIAENRDRAAFESLFLYFGPRVKALLLKSGADHALAEDIVQDVMMTVWRKVDLYAADRGSVSTWIFTIARNARIDRLRRQSSRPYDDVETIEVASDHPEPDESLHVEQRAVQVAEALATLPREQREIIELAYMQDLPQRTIAEKLSLPLGTVKSRMRLAYDKLKGKLEDYK